MAFIVRRKTIIDEAADLMAWYANMRDIYMEGTDDDAIDDYQSKLMSVYILASNLDMENEVLKRAAEIYPDFSLTRSKEETDNA